MRIQWLILLLALPTGSMAGPPPLALFDGTSLDAWEPRGKAAWRIEEGVLVGGQDGDPKRAGLLCTKQTFQDFDLSLAFKIDEHGKYNSGVYLRRNLSTKNPCYQVNIGRAAAGEYTGLYTNDWLDKGDEKDVYRKPLAWNTLRIRAKGAHIQIWLNEHKITDFTDKDPAPELLQPGVLALQTYGAEGHPGWVKFRDIKIHVIGQE
jgi:hypothetical protein